MHELETGTNAERSEFWRPVALSLENHTSGLHNQTYCRKFTTAPIFTFVETSICVRKFPYDDGLKGIVDDYRKRIRELEQQRPAAFENPNLFLKIQLYREDVVRISPGALAAPVFQNDNVD